MEKGTKIQKKLVNDSKNCVKDSLIGFVLSHLNVKLLEGCNAIIRSDLLQFKDEQKVCTITGGGSGHEPFAIGYVGKGLLTASVAGDVFAAPSTANILHTLRNCYTDVGVLFIVTNYTGDRLAFGKVVEIAKTEGKKVNMVVVGEDCALVSKDKSAGRRGLCGTIFIHKMAGAMAEEGKSLSDMTSFLKETANEMSTISISLSSCSVPGKPPGFHIPLGKIEFGLGIHGEAGVVQMNIDSAESLTIRMIEHIISSKFIPKIVCRNVAVIVNNLGGTSNLELSIMAKEALICLHSKSVSVIRCYVGSFVTSLEMAGVSLTVMLLNDERLRYLDASCECSIWPKSAIPNEINEITMSSVKPMKISKEYNEQVSGKIGLLFFRCIKEISNLFITSEEDLNELDRAGGDGDTGTTFARCVSILAKKCADENHIEIPINDSKDCLLYLAKEVEANMGGSSGALISLFLTAASNAVDKSKSNMTNFIKCLELGISAIKTYGGALEGDRTMIDALQPALEALLKNSSGNKIVNVLEMVAEAARNGANATVNMKASAGRASYVSSKYLVAPDPGAMAVAWIFETISKIYTEIMTC